MRKVELTILAKDFGETNYFSASDCVITRALHRAGLIDYVDIGPFIALKDDGDIEIPTNQLEHLTLRTMVQQMYGIHPDKEDLTPADFTFTLTFLNLE